MELGAAFLDGKRRSVVQAIELGALAKDRYCGFFTAASDIPGPLNYISLPAAGEASVEPLFIINEQGSLAISMPRALAT